MALCFDYSDARAIVGGKPLARHLLPEYIPQREKQTIACVKIRQNGKTVRCIMVDGEKNQFLINSLS